MNLRQFYSGAIHLQQSFLLKAFILLLIAAKIILRSKWEFLRVPEKPGHWAEETFSEGTDIFQPCFSVLLHFLGNRALLGLK